ncbi:enolase C-terminal domain-like protein [Streptomyces sp. H27-D2]|uniref:enolase C-terminal domain-like protein n=1 Tax=Streptomyces sp. H27-D2 TaxID=3046304 RepID=UPI002DB60330|nr:enolase C-terminal domain-like protein [Streptomyces sp. H27-D2]MEC4015050.1 enolase C-terminal domain-like protein [Streptomyces sp. H27-D2]
MRTSFDHPAARRTTSDSLVLSLEADGVSGIGECAPRRYVTGETADSVTSALRRVDLDAVFELLTGVPPQELLDLLRRNGFSTTFQLGGGNNLICLLETAVLDWLGQRLDLGARALLPGHGQGWARGPLLISQVLDLSIEVEEFLATRGPFHFVKIKASGDIERDARTVKSVRGYVGEDVTVMVDANMCWTPTTAVPNAWRLRESGADYVEEPLPKGSWDGLRALRREGGIGVMLDESVCTAEDAHRAVREEACDAFNIRVAKNGGTLGAARLIAYAQAHGLRFQLGVQVAEVGPLINAGRALAFNHPGALTVEAGQSDRFFPDMIVSPRPAVNRGANTISPAEGAGWGMTLNDNAKRWLVPDF